MSVQSAVTSWVPLAGIHELLSSSYISLRNVLAIIGVFAIGLSVGVLPTMVFWGGVILTIGILGASVLSATLYRKSIISDGGYIEVVNDGYRTSFVFPSDSFFASWGMVHSIVLFDADFPHSCAALVEHEKGHIKTMGFIRGIIWATWGICVITLLVLAENGSWVLTGIGGIVAITLFSGVRMYAYRVGEVVADMWACSEFGSETVAEQLEAYVAWKVDSDEYHASVDELSDDALIREYDNRYGRFRQYPYMEKRLRLIRGDRVWWMGIVERVYTIFGVSLTDSESSAE